MAGREGNSQTSRETGDSRILGEVNMEKTQKQEMKKGVGYFLSVFILGLFFYFIGGLEWLVFYMLLVLSLVFGSAKLIERHIKKTTSGKISNEE